MTKIYPPTRNFLRTYRDTIFAGKQTYANTQGERLLDLIASYGGIVSLVKHTHLEHTNTTILDIGFKLPKSDVDNFLKEEGMILDSRQ